jgi:hypothetical protein
MAEYDEYGTVLAMRASLAFDSPLWSELPTPQRGVGVGVPADESADAFAKRVDTFAASKKRATKLFVLPKGTFVLQCVVAFDPPFEGGAVVLATTQDDANPNSIVKVDGEVAKIVPAIGSDTELWLRRDGEPTKGRVEVVIAYVKATPVALAALPATEYPKWIGAGHDGVVVKSKVEEDALSGKVPEAPASAKDTIVPPAKPAATPAPTPTPANALPVGA